MSLTLRQQKKCMDCLEYLLSFKMSQPFATPVDRNEVPEYFKVIRHPMDLGTIHKKLKDMEYKSVSEFKSDVELVWSNAIQFNGPKNIISIFAKYLHSRSKERFEFLSDNEKDDWLRKLGDLQARLNSVLAVAPPNMLIPAAMIAVQPPQIPEKPSKHNNNNNNNNNSKQKDNNTAKNTISSSNSGNINSNGSAPKPRKQLSIAPQTSSPPSAKSSGKAPKSQSSLSSSSSTKSLSRTQSEPRSVSPQPPTSQSGGSRKGTPPPNNKQTPPPQQPKQQQTPPPTKAPSSTATNPVEKPSNPQQTSQPPSRSTSNQKNVRPKQFPQEELEKIAEKINNIVTDELKIQKVISLINKKEPEVEIEEEIEISILKYDTLVALKELVNSF